MNRKLRAEDAGDGGFNIIDQADGAVVDWIAKPASVPSSWPGQNDAYIKITEKPEQWSADMRWIVTTGTRIIQTSGLGEGRIGTIRGQGRSRKANRLFARSLRHAAVTGRDLDDADFETLIDGEGPLVEWDDAPGVWDWFPGQASGLLAPLEGGPVPVLGGGSEDLGSYCDISPAG